MNTIVLNNKQESELEKIYQELIYSLKKTYSEEQISQLFFSVLKDSSVQTYQSKKDMTVSIFQSIGKVSGKAFNFSKNKVKTYQQNGFKQEWEKDLAFSKRKIQETPDQLKQFSTNLKEKWKIFQNEFVVKSKDEKIEYVATAIMGVMIFYASAGGTDFEGGIPDSDLMLGIGFHRHLLSHSIIIGFLVEIMMRSGVEIINKSYCNLPADHHVFWDNVHHYINKHKGVAVGAMWAGISVHLLQDSGIFGHGMKPYTGIPFEMSMEAHQGLFAANGTASAIIAGNMK